MIHRPLPSWKAQLLDPATVHWPHSRLEPFLADRTEEQIREALPEDAWLRNYYLSVWEKINRKITLKTYPWHQAYAIADVCNARCPFCNSAYEKSGLFNIKHLPRLGEAISYARTLIFTGGEATVHPQFGEVLRAIESRIDPRCFFSLITNGTRLGKFMAELLATPVSLAVSLNAGTAATHNKVMHLGPDAWSKILESIRAFRAEGRYVALSMVVTRDNLAEVPMFIDLAHDLKVNAIYVRTLNPIRVSRSPVRQPNWQIAENYPALHPATHPDFVRLRSEAAAAIAGSTIPVMSAPDQWEGANLSIAGAQKLESVPAEPIAECRGQGLPSPVEAAEAVETYSNPYGRLAPYSCDHVYYALQMLDQTQMYSACCFMRSVPGYEPVGFLANDDFMTLRNSPAFMELRRRLQDGPLYPACLSCTYQLGY